MDTNTDPARAHDELRVQAALLRTPEFLAQFDPDKFAGQLERIAAALAQQPAAVDEERMKRDIAALQAENERLRAEVREAREFRDKMVNAIGNDQLRRFIEKHGEPVPLTIRMQESEARAERLAEALEDIRSRLANLPTHPEDPWEFTAICRIADAALAREGRNG